MNAEKLKRVKKQYKKTQATTEQSLEHLPQMTGVTISLILIMVTSLASLKQLPIHLWMK